MHIMFLIAYLLHVGDRRKNHDVVTLVMSILIPPHEITREKLEQYNITFRRRSKVSDRRNGTIDRYARHVIN